VVNARSEVPRPPTSQERLLARHCAGVLSAIAGFMGEAAANEAQVSDLLIARMQDFTAFPLMDNEMMKDLRKGAPHGNPREVGGPSTAPVSPCSAQDDKVSVGAGAEIGGAE